MLSHHLIHHMEPPPVSDLAIESIGSLEDGAALATYESDDGKPRVFEKRATFEHLTALLVSTVVSTTLVAPLKRLKILMQTESMYPTRVGGSKYLGIIQGIREISRTSGFKGLWRGNGANILRAGPAACLQVIFLDRLRSERYPVPSLSGYEAVVIGGLAGLAATSFTYPLDVAHARLSVQTGSSAVGSLRNSSTLGRGHLFRGLLPTYLGVFPYVGLSFAVYETLRPALPKRNDGRYANQSRLSFHVPSQPTAFSGLPTSLGAIICGTFAGGVAQSAAYPFDTIRRRMQVYGISSAGYSGVGAKTLMATVQNIWRTDGLRGFYRGWLPTMVKIIPSTIAGVATYEHVKTHIVDMRLQNFSRIAPAS